MSRTGSLVLFALFLMLHGMRARGEEVPFPPKVGKPLPPLALWNLQHDESLSITKLRPKKVLLIYFGSWSEACREAVPKWYETLKPHVDEGKLVIVGIVEEQHPDRARLFAQWKGITGPLLQDPVNYVHVSELPVVVAVDENGIVRARDCDLETVEKKFIKRKYSGKPAFIPPNTEEPPNTRVTRRLADEARGASACVEHGEALLLAGEPAQVEEAIKVYAQALEYDKENARAEFGLGTAYLMQFEGEKRQAGDFQRAIDAWTRAVSLAPGNHVFRARLQQYGPKVAKQPAPYGWIEAARKDIRTRGDVPIALAVEPNGAETGRKMSPSDDDKRPAGDPKGKVARDKKGLISIEETVVRSTEKSHDRIHEIHLIFRPSVESGGQWGGESEALRVWVKGSKSVKVSPEVLEWSKTKEAANSDVRTLNFTATREGKSRKPVTIKGYALCHVREGQEGKSQFLRQDFQIKIR